VVERSFQGDLPVKERSACHFPMWHMPMHWAELIAYIVSIWKKIFYCFIKQPRLPFLSCNHFQIGGGGWLASSGTEFAKNWTGLIGHYEYVTIYIACPSFMYRADWLEEPACQCYKSVSCSSMYFCPEHVCSNKRQIRSFETSFIFSHKNLPGAIRTSWLAWYCFARGGSGLSPSVGLGLFTT
jgi:hypothetical protein